MEDFNSGFFYTFYIDGDIPFGRGVGIITLLIYFSSFDFSSES
jgi:hypothetical protein